jgi:hypothetical protein
LTVAIDGDGSFSAARSQSDQTTDFGSPQYTVSAVAYQLSAEVGRGFPSYIDGSADEVSLNPVFTVGTADTSNNASVTPTNPAHVSGDTLLCIAITRDGSTLACATSGWAAADGITNPTSLGASRQLYLFQNECDSSSETAPTVTTSGGASGNTIAAVVIRIPNRDTAANFVLGTVSSNGSNSTNIAFAQNSPSIDDGNAIISIGFKNNNLTSGSSLGLLSGQTAGLDWVELVDLSISDGSDAALSVCYAVNDSGSAYTAGTGATVSGTWTVGATSGAVYLEAPLT